MIGVVAKLKVKAGEQAGFEEVASKLVAAVNANEPGCKLYRLFKVRESETDYVFMEKYDDEAAVEAHRGSDHFKTMGAAMGPFLDGRPEIIRMDMVE